MVAADNRAAQDRVATLALSLFAIHGYPAPGGEALGTIVHAAMASIGPDELRRPENISTSSLGRLDELVKGSVEAGRPRNRYGADAARLAQAGIGPDGQRGGGGFGYIDALRAGSSARYREISNDGKSSGGQSGVGLNGTGNPVTAEFARSFAGTGMVGGTLRTFAEVGLDRGTFNEFRREGFSKAQIKDNAQDTRALGWKGKEDLSIAQHALPEARKAAIAVEQAKTPEALAKAQEREAEVVKQVDALPDNDRRKHGTRRFFKHVLKKSQHAERHKAIGASAERDDATAAKDQAGPTKAVHAAAQDGLMAKGAAQVVRNVAVASSRFDDAFGSAAPAVPTKPVPIKIAAVKPAAPTVG